MPETDPLPRISRIRMPIWGWLLLLPVLCVIVILVNLFLFVPKLEIGPETTFISGPLKSDGTINYIQALDDQLSEGVTLENNAYVLLLEAYGPDTYDPEHQARAFKKLGISMLPEDGDYLIDIYEFMERKNIEGEEQVQVYDNSDIAGTRAWTAEEFPLVYEWLLQNEVPRQKVIEATLRTRYYAPLVPDDEDALLFTAVFPEVSKSRSAVRILKSHATYLAGQGDVDGALTELMAIFRLAYLNSQRPTILCHLTANALNAIAVEALNGILLSGKIDSAQADKFSQEFAQLPPLLSLAETIDTGGRFGALDTVFMISEGRAAAHGRPIVPKKYSINANVVLRQFNISYDGMVAALMLEARQERLDALEKLTQKYQSRMTKSNLMRMQLSGLIGNRKVYSQATAELLLALTMPALEQAQSANDRAELRMQVVPILFALAAYKTETGTYPESLDQLTPKYIDAIPNDFFTNEPLQYTRTETAFRLYSLGVDGIDQGGNQGQNGDDIPFGEPLVEVHEE